MSYPYEKVKKYGTINYMKKGNLLRELWWAIKTKKLSPGMSLFHYFCWRIVRTNNLPR